MESGETVAKNLADIKQTSAMFKNAVSMMGANEQILAPAAEKLDQFVALGSGGQYANYQEQAQMAPILQLCQQQERLVEMLPGRELKLLRT
jgi:conjugal transfer mating pair stabilization protein TraG